MTMYLLFEKKNVVSVDKTNMHFTIFTFSLTWKKLFYPRESINVFSSYQMHLYLDSQVFSV